MKIIEIYEFLQHLSPFENQEVWDNSGLILGNFLNEVNEICLSLDVDSTLIDNLEDNILILTHHPLIFKGLKQIDQNKYPSSLIYKMIKKNISLISLHTNFDKSHLNEYVAKEILGFKILEIDEFICYMKVDMRFDDLVFYVKEKFALKHTKISKSKEYINTIALTTGSGGDFISNIQADCFLTGDLKYHQALEAMENKLSLIDIGHYESEKFFPQALKLHLENLPLKVIISNSKNPFEVV